ncbi:MAG: DUF6580 family putative transport protein [Candidatus Omnitrophota bacterium]
MIAYFLIILGFLLRLLPHAPNMVPIAAIALFSGAYLNKKIVPWVPFCIMALSDMIIGLHSVVFFTWGSFIIIGFMGGMLKKRKTPGFVFGASVLSALLFFVITNFGVALMWYPHTMQGFIACYIKALPFLRNTLVSNVVFSLAIFGVYEVSLKFVKKTRFQRVLLAN